MDVFEAVRLTCQAIVDKKGCNILTLDVRGVSTITDYFIIAEGSVPRHVISLAHYVDEVLREKKITPVHSEGMRDGDWVVFDYTDFILHLFLPELRELYALEELWKEGKVVNVPVEYGRSAPLLSHENEVKIRHRSHSENTA